ncbi:hypothetical protein TIFTF001_022397 [Ficus carica]|uniref:Retrotransposon gag domain-containing protein n=1 Tax=Ficus carica TaxID=3494 RepID=A0AA88AJW2_FICCA|nr:hypothetical protein TIFTF001_022397 [Ficus carica]
MRLQWPRFLTKPEPEVPRTPARPEYNIRQCPDEGQLNFEHNIHEQGKYNSACSIGFVVYTCLRQLYLLSESSLSYVYAVGGSLQSWYQRGFLRIGFTVSLPSPPSLYDIMDPERVEEDREAVTSFYESFPLVFDGTRLTVSLAAWLYDMELIFRTSHIQARLQVSLASRCLRADARLWWMTIGEQAMPERTWGHFRSLEIGRYGPIPAEGADAPPRDPEIY